MSGRAEPPRIVLTSIENPEGNRCVDVFARPDGTFGFAEFRRDPEDGGVWTPAGHYSDSVHATREAALAAATDSVPWLNAALGDKLDATPHAGRTP